MTTMLVRGLTVFLILIIASTVMMNTFDMEFGQVDFWKKHGVFFLIFISIFPRLTLLFSSVAFGGFFWWLGFFFFPRILVASLATVAYFHTNPVLVTISWLVAVSGEYFEKWGIRKNRFIIRTHRMGGGPPPFQEEPHPHTTIKKDDAIEAEFTKK
jgi:hypothetical protein